MYLHILVILDGNLFVKNYLSILAGIDILIIFKFGTEIINLRFVI